MKCRDYASVEVFEKEDSGMLWRAGFFSAD